MFFFGSNTSGYVYNHKITTKLFTGLVLYPFPIGKNFIFDQVRVGFTLRLAKIVFLRASSSSRY